MLNIPGVPALVTLAEVRRLICYDSAVTPGTHPRRMTQEAASRPPLAGRVGRELLGEVVDQQACGLVPARSRSSSKQQGTAYDPRASFFCPLAEVVGLALVSQPTDADKTAAL